MLSFEEALKTLLEAAQPVSEVRTQPLTALLGRILAEDQVSTVNVPPLDNSAMDGYAVRAADIREPGITLPVSQRIPAGTVGTPLQPGTAARIFTGAPIPQGADAVLMQEVCSASEQNGQTNVTFHETVTVGRNIRRSGEDLTVGHQILKAGTRLRAQEIALAATAGLPTLPVYRRVRVGVFFTGDELVQPGDPLPPGAIYNSNRYALRALLESMGCEVRDLGQVPDSLDATRAALRQAADNDLVLTSGGVSVGEEDHVKPAVEAEGRIDMWKIAIKPGKPLAFGEIRRSNGEGHAWFLGLPGNPVAAFITFLMMVRPFILRLQGDCSAPPQGFLLPAGFDLPRPDKRTEFLRARLEADGRLSLFRNQSSGVVTSLCWADGLIVNPANQAIQSGDLVRFIPFTAFSS